MIWVVVPAAGRGVRAGGVIPKQYQPVSGRPLIEHTLTALASHPRIAGLLVVLAADDRYWPGWDMLQGKPLLTAVGGNERAESVLAGLAGLPADVADDDFVLVHDAARPCVCAADLDALLETQAEHGALLATPLVDTLKRADGDGQVLQTVPREGLWRALTPQRFRRGPLTAALRAAVADGVVVTDEAMAMERTGAVARLVEGSPDNIKVTTAQDFERVSWLLAQRAGMEVA